MLIFKGCVIPGMHTVAAKHPGDSNTERRHQRDHNNVSIAKAHSKSDDFISSIDKSYSFDLALRFGPQKHTYRRSKLFSKSLVFVGVSRVTAKIYRSKVFDNSRALSVAKCSKIVRLTKKQAHLWKFIKVQNFLSFPISRVSRKRRLRFESATAL